MAQKNASPKKNLKKLIISRGLNPDNYTVMKELNYTVLLKVKRYGTVKVIDKRC